MKLTAVSITEENVGDASINEEKESLYNEHNKDNDVIDNNEDDEPRSEDEILIDEGGM